jgi:hypothetical protein
MATLADVERQVLVECREWGRLRLQERRNNSPI